MNKRLKNIIFGAVGFGLGFSILQLVLSIYFYPFGYLGEVMVVLVPMFLGTLSLGALVGFIFGFKRIDRRKFVWSGVWSFGLLAGILLPVTIVLSVSLFYGLDYTVRYHRPAQYDPAFWILLHTPYQLYGALFGILAGAIIGRVFGRGQEAELRMTFLSAIGFGIGGLLMGWIAPIDTYLGSFNLIGLSQGNSASAFLLNRLLGGFLFGALGGAFLGKAYE